MSVETYCKHCADRLGLAIAKEENVELDTDVVKEHYHNLGKAAMNEVFAIMEDHDDDHKVRFLQI